MKTFLKKSLVLLAIMFSMSTIFQINTMPHTVAIMESTVDPGGGGSSGGETPSSPISGAIGGCRDFLGMTSWDCGIRNNWQGEENLSYNIWTIVANVSNDLIVIAAYLVLGYVIYGGYLYMFAAGNTTKTADGKKTLINAFIGLTIVMLAKVIVNAIHIAFRENSGMFNENCVNHECVTANTLVGNLIGWVIGVAGLVAVAFIVIGAIGYITSSGDTNKLQKAKNTIIYALIGLAIVGLAEVITALVSSTVRNASSTTSHNNSSLIIAKESSK